MPKASAIQPHTHRLITEEHYNKLKNLFQKLSDPSWSSWLEANTVPYTPQGFRRPIPPEAYHALEGKPLSKVELEILKLFTEGFRDAEIATIRCVAEVTIRSHRQNIYRKLGVHTRTQAVLKAFKLGLVENK